MPPVASAGPRSSSSDPARNSAADYVARLDRWLADRTSASGLDVADGTPPMFHPCTPRGMEPADRIVVSPPAQYSAVDGMPTDWHPVHLGGRAVGGAGLAMTETTCTSPDARITPGCPGIGNDEQAAAWARTVDFVHANSDAKIGVQLGHAGRGGSTKVMWQGVDDPRRGRLGDRRPVAGPPPVRRRGPAGDDARRHGTGDRRPRRRRPTRGDRIPQETGVPTMTVGAIASAEDANTIIAAGRAALCCLARPHLVDPYRTLDAAIEQDYRGHVPPKRYRPGRGARRRAQEP